MAISDIEYSFGISLGKLSVCHITFFESLSIKIAHIFCFFKSAVISLGKVYLPFSNFNIPATLNV